MGANRVVAPDGRVWTVGRRWVRHRPRLRRRDRDSDSGADVADAGSSWGDLLSFDDITPAGILTALAFTIAVALLFLVVWPLVAIAIELLIVLLIALAGVVGRVLFRRPWTVEARAARDHLSWEVPGWRASGELIDDIGRRIVAGEDPRRIELSLRNQDQLHVG